MKKLVIAMLLCMVGVGFVGCSSNNDDEPTEQYTFQKIKGRWYQTAYLNSANYFTALRDGSYIEFEPTGYAYYDGTLKDTETGTFSFDKVTDRVVCRPSGKGKEYEWNINVSFQSDNKAIFTMVGQYHRNTIEVERANK